MDATPHITRVHAFARWALVAAWAGLIFYFSSLPASRVPGRFAVLGHLGEYVVLGCLVLLASTRSGPTPRSALGLLALCALYALSDEFHQAFVPGRTPDPADWAVDTVGSAIGIAAGMAALALRQRGAVLVQGARD